MTRWSVVTRKDTMTLLGWPTDTFAVDVVVKEQQQQEQQSLASASSCSLLHTVLIFVPGNPGLMEWYIPLFQQLLQQLGPGYAARGVANAAHSVDPSKVRVSVDNHETAADPAIPWTVDGQALHKCAFVDAILQQLEPNQEQQKYHSKEASSSSSLQLIFVSHSIGCHFTQRLCIWRPDLLQKTILLLQLMPFVRFRPPTRRHQFLLQTLIAPHPETTIQVGTFLLRSLLVGNHHTPTMTTATTTKTNGWSERLIWRNVFADPQGRQILQQLLQIPEFVRNFFTLGCEEMRDVPEQFDLCALRYITQPRRNKNNNNNNSNDNNNNDGCRMAFLFANHDVWAPEAQRIELQQLLLQQQQSSSSSWMSNNISITYRPELKHDFVSTGSSQSSSSLPQPQVPIVVQYCLDQIRNVVQLRQEHKQQSSPPSIRPSEPGSTTIMPQPFVFERSRL